MPIYEFKCEWCDHRFEEFRRLPEHKPTAKCSVCGHISSRVPSAPAIQFKGEGWTKNG